MGMRKSSKSGKGGRPLTRHLPERTCVACRAKGQKLGLIRIIRNAEGVGIDLRGKKSGRGAYLCPFYECWEQGLKGNRLDHSLHTVLKQSERLALAEYGKSLPRRSKEL